MELQGSEFLISHTFQHMRYISIAHTGNFIMYALGPECKIMNHCPKSDTQNTYINDL